MDDNNLFFSEEESLSLGIKYLNRKEYDLAVKELSKALKINPDNNIAHAKLGHAYLQQGNFAQAMAQFNQALELNPKSIESLFGLGFYYFGQRAIGTAIEKFLHVLRLEPDNEHAHFGLGLCYQQKENFSGAIEEFTRVIKTNPQHPQANYQLGLCYHHREDSASAIEELKKAIKIDTSNREAHIVLARLYLEQDQITPCLDQLKKVKDWGPQENSYHRLMSQLYIKQKQFDLAIKELQKAVNHNSTNNKVGTSSVSEDAEHCHKIKILRIPNFYGDEIISTEMNSILLPPLALGSIVSYLRSQGIPIDQDDLHIKIHHDNYFSSDPEEKIDEAVFFDEQRVVTYAKGANDPQIHKIMACASRKISLEGYKIILFSLDSCSMNFSHVMFALCFAKYLKNNYNPIIVLGGLTYFPGLMQEIGFSWPDIDYVICKEGEEVLAKLLPALLQGHPLEACKVDESDGRILYATKVPPSVQPDFDGLPLERYRYRGIKSDYLQSKRLREVIKEFNASQTLLLPFRFIKGCTNRCIFCASSYGGLIDVVSPQTVVEWLDGLQNRYKPTGYLFLNDTLNISRGYLDELCSEIIKRKLHILWSDCVRVDRLDKSSIYKMRQAGCIRMVFGMETASKKMLDYINKDIDLKHLEEMLYWADRAGIWTGVEIISGLPYENDEDVAQTVSFIKRNRRYIDALYYNAFNIKDTSQLRMHPERYGITNVFEISRYEDGFSTFVKYGFDEANGLKWPQKVKQIITAFKKIIKELGEIPFAEHEYEHFLFFLYSKYSDKKRIKKLFYSVGDEKIRHLKQLRKERVAGEYLKKQNEKILVYG